MLGKIALEEHYAIEDTLQDSNGYLPAETWDELSERLLDIEGRRIDEMDENGVQMMILSLNAPAVQAIYDRECERGYSEDSGGQARGCVGPQVRCAAEEV